MLTESLSSEPIGILGSGRLAQALGRLLLDEGAPVVCLAGRDPARTRLAAAFVGAEGVPVAGLGSRAARIIIAVSDAALPEVAETLAAAPAGLEIALHTCGTRDIEELQPLRRRGIACGTLHPLQTVASPLQGVAALRGAAFAISGDAAAVLWAEEIVQRVKGQILKIPPAARPLYHAAAVMASNYVAALLDAAQTLLAAAAGKDRDAVLAALEPLVRASVENILARGPVAALTGPIERGDAATVRAHVTALAAATPEIRELYRAAGLQTLDMARRKALDAASAEGIKTILRGTDE